MAEHSTTFRGPDTPEAFLADRQRTWGSFTSATMWTIIFMIVLLVGMAVFLL
jgi:Bacterial aa3 type cytochrome c oxidase subunit IV